MTTQNWSFVVVAGPDSGRAITLPSGRHQLGRARSGHVIDDPSWEVHHLAIDVGDDVRCVQLSGRIPVRVDGRPLEGLTLFPDGALVEIGASLLRVGRPDGHDDPPAGAPGEWPVTLGVGDRREGGGGVDPSRMPFDEQVAFDASRRRTGVPIVIDLARFPMLGIAGPHCDAVARSIVEAMPEDAAASEIATCGSHRFRGLMRGSEPSPSVLLVLADTDEDLPVECTARLTVGARWRGTFVADTTAGFDDVVHLHVAGAPPVRNRLGPAFAVRPESSRTRSRPSSRIVSDRLSPFVPNGLEVA